MERARTWPIRGRWSRANRSLPVRPSGPARRVVLGSHAGRSVGFAPMSKTIRRQVAVSALSALLLLAACGDDDGDTRTGNVIRDGLGCSITSADRPTDKPEVEVPEDADSVTEVATEDLVEPTADADGDTRVEDYCDVTKKRYLTLDMVGV